MVLAALVVALLTQQAVAPSDFAAEVAAAGKLYQPVLDANQALLKDGKLAGSTQALFDRVPEDQRTAAQCFVLGNVLFSMESAKSYELHRKAYELAPDESATQFEWAIERHRKREYAEADALYAKLTAQPGKTDPRAHAFRADCLLHLGKLSEAVAEWKAADLRNRHTSVEQGFSWIYGKPHPIVERARLLDAARAPKAEKSEQIAALESLILLDLEWETDWWNARPKQEYLACDLPLAAATLGADSPRQRQLALLVELTPKDDDLGLKRMGPEFKELVGKKHVAGADVPLAENSFVAGRLLDMVVTSRAATPAELLDWYGRPLRARVDATPGDAKALEILAALYEKGEKSAELAALEELGWKKFGAVSCAYGILRREGDAITSDDPLLKAALAKFPDDPTLRGVAVGCAAREEKGEREAIVAYLEAHLARMVSWNTGAQKGFLVLEKLLPK
jgi:hypothetical protein